MNLSSIQPKKSMTQTNSVAHRILDVEKYRMIVENVNECIIIVQEGKIKYANPKTLEVTGYSYDELTSKSFIELVHPDDREMFTNHHAKRIQGVETPKAYLMRIIDKRGNRLWIKNNVVIVDRCGRPATLNFLSDITLQKITEDALRTSENRFRIIADQTGQLIYDYNIDTGKIEWSGASEKITGYTENEIKQVDIDRWEQLIHHEDRRKAIDQLDKAHKTASPYKVEYRFCRKDGSYATILDNGAFISNGNGRLNRMLGVMIDVSDNRQAEDELKQYRERLETLVKIRTSQLETAKIRLESELAERCSAEEARQQSEERYRFLLENTAEGYYLVDLATGQFIFGNQKIGDLFGYPLKEASQLSLWDVIHPSEHSRIQKGLQEMVDGRSESSSRYIYTCIRKDGSTFRGEISAKIDKFRGKRVIQGIVRDVTENEQFMRRLQEIQKLETISTLAGGIAHDFNNILMAMQGNVSLLLVKMNKTDALYGKVRNIQQQIKTGANLIRQLVGFARGGKYEAKIIDINRLIDQTIRMFHPNRKKIDLTVHYDAHIWLVTADRSQIEQVLLNIYVNAWQAMPHGGQLTVTTVNCTLSETEVRPFDSAPGKYVRISITDSGLGMDAQTMKRIFDPFYTTKGPGEGTGLGLSSAYGIVKNHGGFIKVLSEEGRGSVFNIYLPASKPKVQKESDFKEMLMVGNETILFVDDEAMILEAGKEMLAEFGYSVHAADCGEKAIDMLLESGNEIDLVVLDLVLPGLSGRETLEKMRSLNPKLKFLLASGQNENASIDHLPSCNYYDFIQKPFTAIELSQKIRQALDA